MATSPPTSRPPVHSPNSYAFKFDTPSYFASPSLHPPSPKPAPSPRRRTPGTESHTPRPAAKRMAVEHQPDSPGSGVTAGFAAAALTSNATFNLPPPSPAFDGPFLHTPIRSQTTPTAPTSAFSREANSAMQAATSAASTMTLNLPRRSVSAAQPSASRYSSILPIELSTLIFETSTVILDVRPHGAYTGPSGHLVGSINICVPTTLLRRPSYPISRIAETLAAADKDKLLNCLMAITQQVIVVVDADTTALAADSPAHSLLAKLEREGCKGDLRWLKGGMAAVVEAVRSQQVPMSMLAIGSGSNDHASSTSSSSTSTSSLASRSRTSFQSTDSGSISPPSSFGPATSSPVLQVRDLSLAAFQQSSTQAHITDLAQQAGFGGQDVGGLDTYFGSAANKASRSSSRAAANPFFDNIRQNQEGLNKKASLTDLKPYEVPDVYQQDEALRRRLPPFLRDLIDLSPASRAQVIAKEYFDVEEREQQRLQGLMSWHSAQDQKMGMEAKTNPMSIAAGIEKGHLNRYRNVFPYEHSRIRLQRHATGESDYVNASRINLRGSELSYIATQGPLPTSYNDFWQLIYQERVPVIVMLTNLFEAGREKCGDYFQPGRYGKITLETISRCAAAQQEDEAAHQTKSSGGGGFFGAAPTAFKAPKASNIVRRTFQLTHDDTPMEPHTVRHLQYADWLDFDVPPNPAEVVGLIKEANEAKQESRAPVVVHCSAGVGRTGSYITIDALLDTCAHGRIAKSKPSSPSAMVVDEPPPFTPGGPLSPRSLSKRQQTLGEGYMPTRERHTPPLETRHPIKAVVDEMREQRMSMVANSAQYSFAYTAVLEGLANGMKLRER